MRSAPVFEFEDAPLERCSLAVEMCVQRPIGCLEVLLKLAHHTPLVDHHPRHRIKLDNCPRAAGPSPAPARVALAARTHVLAVRPTPDFEDPATCSSATAGIASFGGEGVSVGGGGGFDILTTVSASCAIAPLGLVRHTVATLIVRLLGHITAAASAATGAEEWAERTVPVVDVGVGVGVGVGVCVGNGIVTDWRGE